MYISKGGLIANAKLHPHHQVDITIDYFMSFLTTYGRNIKKKWRKEFLLYSNLSAYYVHYFYIMYNVW